LEGIAPSTPYWENGVPINLGNVNGGVDVSPWFSGQLTLKGKRLHIFVKPRLLFFGICILRVALFGKLYALTSPRH